MGRIVDDVSGDPVGIDGGSVKNDGEGPVVRGESGQLLTQPASLFVNAIQGRFDINLSGLRSELGRWRPSKVGPGL